MLSKFSFYFSEDKISFIETRGILENSHYSIYPVQLNEKFILRLDEVYLANGDKALLPLASGETFTYKDSFDVTKNYPEVCTLLKYIL